METHLQNRHFYTVYGLHLVSNSSIPEVTPVTSPGGDARPVFIHFVGQAGSLPIQQPIDAAPWYIHPYKDEHGIPALQVWRVGQRFYLAYLGGNHFVVNLAGDEVWAAWPEQVHTGYVTAQLLGPVLGLVLQLRGFLVLHASVSAVDGRAIAILGTSGSGKSTVAAELYRQGCQVLSDDIAALLRKDGRWWVQPGYPRLRLWPQTAEELYGPAHNLRSIAPGYERWDKRYLEFEPSSTAFGKIPLPLETIFILNWSESGNTRLRLAPLASVEAFANLDAHCFMGYLLDNDRRQRQTHDLVSLLDQVRVYQVQPEPEIASLPELGSAILDTHRSNR